MPRKRSLDIRLTEMASKLEDLKLEKAIEEMRLKKNLRRPRRRRRV